MASTRRPFGPPRSGFDLRDMFLDSSRMEEIRNLQARSLGQVTPGQSRILKRNQTMDEKYLMPKEEAMAGRGVSLGLRPPTISSKTRASEALRKLAQIETKILNRKQVPMAWSDVESDSTSIEQSLPKRTGAASVSSQYPHRTFQKQVNKTCVSKSDGPSGNGSRFLKKKELPTEARSPGLAVGTGKQALLPTKKESASDEEEEMLLLRSLMESSREKEANRNQELPGSSVSRSNLGKVFLDPTPDQPGVLSLLSVDQSSLKSPRPIQSTRVGLRTHSRQASSAGDTVSITASPPILDDFSKSASSKMGCIKLASSPSRTELESSEEPVSEAAADSLHDFRINILSIDDLVLADGDKSDGDQRGTATVVGDGEGLTTESDVSEPPGTSSSAAVQSHSMSRALTASPAYSEDFEQFSGPLALEESLDRTLDTLSKFSSSGQTDIVARQPLSRTEWGRGVTRVVKETAVQTLDPAFAYQWSKAGGIAAVGPALGGAYVDPAPIASHIVSADAIEALTAYSPAVLALNDMLKQQLSLTQQFIEASHQLHGSLLQSLDGDSFHYHTLEEAKEYIRCHRPAPLTMEAALQEVREELQVPASEACLGTCPPRNQ
uniref:RIKEN cDNA 1700030K09 gene n=1 Tax=Mus musculus TaxID=10090 RepID=E9Q7C0_MOUSE